MKRMTDRLSRKSRRPAWRHADTGCGNEPSKLGRSMSYSGRMLQLSMLLLLLLLAVVVLVTMRMRRVRPRDERDDTSIVVWK